MMCGFRPHDRDRRTESMEGVWMGFEPVWKGVALQDKTGFYGYPVNRWSIKRTPNGTKVDRRSTGAIPRRLARLGPFRESLTPAHNRRQKGNAGGHRSAGLRNEQRGKCSDA